MCEGSKRSCSCVSQHRHFLPGGAAADHRGCFWWYYCQAVGKVSIPEVSLEHFPPGRAGNNGRKRIFLPSARLSSLQPSPHFCGQSSHLLIFVHALMINVDCRVHEMEGSNHKLSLVLLCVFLHL